MAYLLDAIIFIQAKNLYYGFDFCPAFWDWLIAGNRSKRVFSIEKVGDEIAAGDDELSAWASERGVSFFLKPDPSLLPVLGEVSSWITSQRPEIRSCRGIDIPPGSRLLSGGPCRRAWGHGRHPRSSC